MRTNKASMFSDTSVRLLFDHILDGFKSSNEGIQKLRDSNLVEEHEYTQLLEKNAQRLIERIKEFKIAQKLVSIFFASMFLWLQIHDQDLEMRRSRRTRVRRREVAISQLFH